MEVGQSTVLIWDTASASPPDGEWVTVLWRSYDLTSVKNSISIPALVEDDALALREQYLAWLYDLGETQIDGIRLIEHIVLDSGLSYWWMTLLTEKSNYSKSKGVEDAIKLMAFVNWCSLHKVERVILHTSNKYLTHCIKAWCYQKSIMFEVHVADDLPRQGGNIKFLYAALPRPLQAIIWLAGYLFKRWPLKGLGTTEWGQTQGEITFFSYLCSISTSKNQSKNAENRYWTKLPTLLKSTGYSTNWLHLYINDGSFKNAREAAQALRALNAREAGKQTHVVLDSFISRNVLTQTLCSWWKLVNKGHYLQKKLAAMSQARSTINAWPLLEQDWLESTIGDIAMSNLLNANLMRSALKRLPHQRSGIYLQENLAWETALIHSWQSKGHGSLVGFPHTTVRFWDLRYFHDRRLYRRTGHHDLPMPDTVAYSGPAVLNAYDLGKYPRSQMTEVEALRYLYLSAPAVRSATLNDVQGDACARSIQVLIMGDYLQKITHLQLRLLIEALPYLPPLVLVLKPHPLGPINPKDYPELMMQLSTEPIAKLLSACDVAYSSPVTTAALDAYCSGIPIVSALDPNCLNMSPLRGLPNVFFANTPIALANALMSAIKSPRQPLRGQDFFRLDKNLTKWQELFKHETFSK